ncbi:hypothetical protein PENSUB_8549 [Penicillium subrubescens]|uniref:Uncharacterized protein n=1 Tax=Penicillium subrubescens TaxID=1316194 RepID=A0A1Q5TG18_9EURO|nr:hypothetical protein PENSUB_8549 [Penicillium subrubescens]
MNDGGGASHSNATFPQDSAFVQDQFSPYERWGGNCFGAFGSKQGGLIVP